MTDPRKMSLAELQKELLVDIATEWLDRVDDEVAAGQTEGELAEQASAFIDGSDWHVGISDRC